MTIWTDFANLAIKQAFQDVKGVRTRTVEAGEGKSETLIFLHGTGGHAEAFSRNMRAHSEHFHVIAMDMIGHGYTDAPDIPYDIATFVEHLGNFLDTRGLKKVSICGESLGAYVATHFALRSPERVKKIVMNTGILFRHTEEKKKPLADVLERTRKATGALTREAVRARLNWLMHEPEKNVTEELIDVRFAVYSQPGRAPITRRIAESILGGVLDDAWNDKWSNENDLKKLRCPALIMWSAHNPGHTQEDARKALAYIPDGRMHVLQKSAHWPQWEESEEYNKVHLAFLRS